MTAVIKCVLYFDFQALEVNKRLNCATDILLESREQLSNIENCRDGLLYGVPISIKDNVGYKVGYHRKTIQPQRVLRNRFACSFHKINCF